MHIRTIGLFNARAKNVVATCRLLVERHGGEAPAEREALERLPGVGRKTANVVLNTASGVPAITVDTHIFRVASRTRLRATGGSRTGRSALHGPSAANRGAVTPTARAGPRDFDESARNRQ